MIPSDIPSGYYQMLFSTTDDKFDEVGILVSLEEPINFIVGFEGVFFKH